MKKSLLWVSLIISLVIFFQGCNELYDTQVEDPHQNLKGLSVAMEKLQPVIKIQNMATEALFRNPEVAGTGTGIDEYGNPTIVVYTINKVEQRRDINLSNVGTGERPTALPVSIDRVPVVQKVTGMFKALADPTARFPRPVPIGVSTGHPDITAGTIGCRVTDGTNVYALSNNHVYANINEATLGDNIIQPGTYDGGTDPADAIGTLHDFEPISFSSDNTMDAAIALVSTSTLGTSTPIDDGYGIPSVTTVDPALEMAVQKYGRTTEWTHGQISEVNVIVDVCYESRGPVRCVKSARFVNQFAITPGTFSDGGDSGSLIVTDNGGNNPVGLLFAGSSTHTIASPIDVVLLEFGVSIDDGSGTGGNLPPTADFTFTTDNLTVTFTDISSDIDGEITAWSWVFGDGGTSTIKNPTHTYSASGTYDVSLTVTDKEDATGTVIHQVNVSDEPSGGLTLTATGYKVRGIRRVDLEWSGSNALTVDIHLNGELDTVTENDGFYIDDLGRSSGTFTYQIFDGENYSNEATVVF